MYRVDVYDFETEEQAKNAQKELEGIRFIRAQTKMTDPQTVLRLYDKLILKNVFSTQVGYQFLYELQEYLKTSPQIRAEQIHRIPVRQPEASMVDKREIIRQNRRLEEIRRELAEAKRLNKNKRDFRKSFRISVGVNVVCVAIILGMFLITALSENNINILNYENKLLDRYENWEKTLTEREAAVREREKELGIEEGAGDEQDQNSGSR